MTLKQIYNRMYYRLNKKRLIKMAVVWAKDHPQERATTMHENYCRNKTRYAERSNKWKSTHAEYRSYHAAKNRCENPEAIGYKNYGGRGIKFCFSSYRQFFAEVGMKPTLKHTIDRIDPNGNYQPGNVRWATRFEQQHNKRV